MTIKAKTTITVKEWFFDKLQAQMDKYNWYIVRTYKTVNDLTIADRTKLRIEEVLGESEKAVKVKVDCETVNGHVRDFTTWIPKSVIC